MADTVEQIVPRHCYICGVPGEIGVNFYRRNIDGKVMVLCGVHVGASEGAETIESVIRIPIRRRQEGKVKLTPKGNPYGWQDDRSKW